MTWDAQKLMAQYDKRQQEQSEWPVGLERDRQEDDISMDVPEAIHAIYRFASISIAAAMQRRDHHALGNSFPLTNTYIHTEEAKQIHAKARQAAKILQTMEKNGIIPSHSFNLMHWSELLEMNVPEDVIKKFATGVYSQFPTMWRLILAPTVKKVLA